jgi:hypothetical protein
MISACSKDDSQQKDPASAQTKKTTKNNQSSEASADSSKENATETSTSTSEDNSSNEEADNETVNGDEQKDYLTGNHEFVASELANLTEKQINAKWGQPEKSEEAKFRYSGTSNFVPAVVHYYQNEKYAVTFVQGKAARLVYSVADQEIPFDDDEERIKALELAGLPTDVEETTDTDTAYVWNDIGGVYEVTMFSKAGFVDYLYITLDEAYK